MNLIKTIILGIVQGVTEFLPISSSGHLVLLQYFMGIESNQMTLNIFLHFGTLIPIIIIFRKDIIEILSFRKEKRHLTYLILVGIIPTGLMGYFFEDFFEKIFSSAQIVGFMLIVTGFLLYLSEKLSSVRINIDEMKEKNALLVGLAQGFAIIPGISRSGSTIVASLLQGLDRESAARYSFLISIPVILGAGLLKLKDISSTGLVGTSWVTILIGTAAAAISGYFAIKYLLKILKKGSLIVFSYYCWIVGIVMIIIITIL